MLWHLLHWWKVSRLKIVTTTSTPFPFPVPKFFFLDASSSLSLKVRLLESKRFNQNPKQVRITNTAAAREKNIFVKLLPSFLSSVSNFNNSWNHLEYYKTRSLKKISWNRLFSKFFNKNVDFMEKNVDFLVKIVIKFYSSCWFHEMFVNGMKKSWQHCSRIFFIFWKTFFSRNCWKTIYLPFFRKKKFF